LPTQTMSGQKRIHTFSSSPYFAKKTRGKGENTTGDDGKQVPPPITIAEMVTSLQEDRTVVGTVVFVNVAKEGTLAPNEFYLADMTSSIRVTVYGGKLPEEFSSLLTYGNVVSVKGYSLRALYEKVKETVPHYPHDFEMSLNVDTSSVRKLDSEPIWLPTSVLKGLPDYSRVNFLGQIQSVGSLQQAKQKKSDEMLPFITYKAKDVGGSLVEITLWGKYSEEGTEKRESAKNGFISVQLANLKMFKHQVQLGISTKASITPKCSIVPHESSNFAAAEQNFSEMDANVKSCPTPVTFCCTGCKESFAYVLDLLAEIKDLLPQPKGKKK